MIVIHIREVRKTPIFRWILALYDTDVKRFVSKEVEDEILRYNEDKNVFRKHLEGILERFSKQGCTNISSDVRKQIFEANGFKLPPGWMSFQV